jgi:ATP-binding cassette subfamily B protein
MTYMFRGFGKYRMVYGHLWGTYGQSWLVRLSFVLAILSRICKLIALPVAISLIITHLSARDFDAAQQAVLIYVAFSLTLGIITTFVKYVGMLGENPVYDKATASYFSRLINTDLDYFNSNLAGYLTTATRHYCDSAIQMVRAIRATYINTVLSILFPLIVIIWLDPWLGLVALALSLIQAVYLLVVSSSIDPYRKQARELYKRNSGHIADAISNILAIKSTAQEKFYA